MIWLWDTSCNPFVFWAEVLCFVSWALDLNPLCPPLDYCQKIIGKPVGSLTFKTDIILWGKCGADFINAGFSVLPDRHLHTF